MSLGGAQQNFNGQFLFLLAYTIINNIFFIVARIATAIILKNDNSLDYKISVPYTVFNLIFWIVMTQFFLLELAVKLRFELLNQVFW